MQEKKMAAGLMEVQIKCLVGEDLFIWNIGER